MSRSVAVLAVCAGMALSGAPVHGQADASATEAQPGRPSFQAAGPRSATAPSGYSDGVTQQRAQAASGLVPLLQRASLLQLLPPESRRDCADEEALRSAAARHPRELAANLDLGWFELQHNEPAQALAPLDVAVRIAPGDVRPKIALAIAGIETGDEPEALQTLHELAVMHAEPGITMQLSAALPLGTEDPPSAQTTAGAAYIKGLALLFSGDTVEARHKFAAGLAQATTPGQRANLSLGMGLTDALRGAQKQAVDELLDAAVSDPGNLITGTLLAAWIAPDAPTAPQALAAVRHTAELVPGSAIAWYNTAMLLARMTQQERSVEQAAAIQSAYDRALAIDPRLAAAHFGRGALDQQEGNSAKAVDEMRQAVRLEPGIAAWHYRLSRALEAAGMREDAAREMAVFRFVQTGGPAEPDAGIHLQGIRVESLEPGEAPCHADQMEHSASSPHP